MALAAHQDDGNRLALFGLILLVLLPFQSSAGHCDGGAYWADKAKKCLACSAGKFSEKGVDKCTVCPPGTISQSRSSECSKCGKDEYSLAESSSCKKCPHGSDEAKGGQCGVGLCGHTCDEVVEKLKTHLDCSWTWNDGCGNEHAPAPFTRESTLFEMCPHQCEAHPNQTHSEDRESDPRFKALHGGDHEHRACRHMHADDNSDHYYHLEEAEHMTLRTCEERCVNHEGCTGIEFKSYWWYVARCEVWLKPILSTTNKTSYGEDAHGYTCLVYHPSETNHDTEVTDGSETHPEPGGAKHSPQQPGGHDSQVPVQPKTAAMALGGVAVVATAGGVFVLMSKKAAGINPAE